ncbi:MAG: PAS domain S-box protein [Gammaproteobacteria bacterium]|nr:MAG: PAS domain S-box protein [Gammaproteobacteria bacterium]
MIAERKNKSKVARYFGRLSIQTKLALIILAASVLVLSVGFISIIYWDVKSIRRDALNETKLAVSILSQDMVKLLLFDSPDIAADAVIKLKEFPNIENAVLYDKKNNDVFHYRKNIESIYYPPAPETMVEFEYHDDYFFAFLPVRYENTEFGHLFFRVSTESQKQKIFGYFKVVILMIPLLMVLSTFIAIKFQEIFSAPILRLARVIKKVYATHDYSHQLEFDEENEIGELYDGFNLMLEQIDFNTNKVHTVNQEIERSNQQLKALNEHLEEQKFALDQAAKVSISDAKGVITYVNDQFCHMSQYSQEELIGQTYQLIRSGYHTDKFFEDLWYTISNGNVWKGEIRNCKKDGSYYWVNTTIVPFLDKGGVPYQYLSIHFDITDRKDAEDALVEAKDLAETAVNAQTEFVSTMSQELRTPMKSLLEILNGILREGNVTDLVNDQIKRAHQSASSLLTLFNDILDYSRILAGKLEFDAVDFALRIYIDEILTGFSEEAEKKGIDLTSVFSTSIPPVMKGDPTRIREIIRTLLSVVLGYVKYGTIALNVRSTKHDGEEYILFEIKSPTLVLSSDLKKKILNAFTRVDGSISQVFSGEGMGPALSKQFIRMMGGEFGLDSDQDDGTNLWFTVRVGGAVGRAAKNMLDEGNAIPNMKILLVADDNDEIGKFKYALSHNKYSYHITKSISDALKLVTAQGVENNQFDVVIFSMNLPLNVLLEASKNIKSNPGVSQMDLVMISMGAQRGDAEKARAAGFKAFLSKPIDIDYLVAHLEIIPSARNIEELLVTKHIFMEVDESHKKRIVLSAHEESTIHEVTMMARAFGLGVDLIDDQAPFISCENVYSMALVSPAKDESEGARAVSLIRQFNNNGHPLPVIGIKGHLKKSEKELCEVMEVDDILTNHMSHEELLHIFKRWIVGFTVEHEGKSR